MSDWRQKDNILTRLYFWLVNSHTLSFRGKRIVSLIWWGYSLKWRTLSFHQCDRHGHWDSLFIGKFEIRIWTDRHKAFHDQIEADYRARIARGEI